MMKIILTLLILSLTLPIQAATRTKGYTKKDGTYVAPHYKSSPNKSKYDNYSTSGNINTYTGKKGSKK